MFFYQILLCLSQVLFTYLLSKYVQDSLRSCQMFVKKGSGFKGKAKVTLVVVAGNEELVSTYLKTADFEQDYPAQVRNKRQKRRAFKKSVNGCV